MIDMREGQTTGQDICNPNFEATQAIFSLNGHRMPFAKEMALQDTF
jgi:hypothetical protein